MLSPKLGYLITLIIICLIVIFYENNLTRLYEKQRILGNLTPETSFLSNTCLFLEQQLRHHEHLEKDVPHNKVDDDNLVLIYNRVPKTGSTSFVGVAYDLCKRNKFHVLHVNVTANSHVLSFNNQYKFVTNVTNWAIIKPALYHGHFAFVDFAK